MAHVTRTVPLEFFYLRTNEVENRRFEISFVVTDLSFLPGGGDMVVVVILMVVVMVIVPEITMWQLDRIG